jgi:hypothetical protein
LFSFQEFIIQAKNWVQRLEREVFIDSEEAESDNDTRDNDIVHEHDVSL